MYFYQFYSPKSYCVHTERLESPVTVSLRQDKEWPFLFNNAETAVSVPKIINVWTCADYFQ
jgi:hypothetical protein